MLDVFKHQFVLNNHNILLITNKINIFITKSLRNFLRHLLLFGPLEFFGMSKTWFLDLNQVKVTVIKHIIEQYEQNVV